MSIGETFLSAFVKGQEHVYQYTLLKEGKIGGKVSLFGRYVVEAHNKDYNTSFSMKVVSHHLAQTHQRQVTELVLIDVHATINTDSEKGSNFIHGAITAVSRRPPTHCLSLIHWFG